MYRRYSEANGNSPSLTQLKRGRIKDLLILVMAGLLIAAIVVGIPALQAKNGIHTTYIQRIQSECDEAVRQVSALSRNAGADSASILARIRSNLYAIRTISALSVAQEGKNLVSEDRILSLQNTVDRYLTYLTTGMDTGEYQTGLQISLEELRTEMGQLR